MVSMEGMETDALAKMIWNYHIIGQKLEKCDCIVVLGSNDLRVATFAASLYHDGWAPLVLFSGGIAHQEENNLLKTSWNRSEAEVFSDVAINLGVPREKIIIEPKAQNTGQNIIFAKELLQHMNLTKVLLVQKPFMERRSIAHAKMFWPEMDFIVTSPSISFDEYPTALITKDRMINIIVGDLQRIKEYPKQGFSIPQDMPNEIWAAAEELIKRGYNKRLISLSN